MPLSFKAAVKHKRRRIGLDHYNSNHRILTLMAVTDPYAKRSFVRVPGLPLVSKLGTNTVRSGRGNSRLFREARYVYRVHLGRMIGFAGDYSSKMANMTLSLSLALSN